MSCCETERTFVNLLAAPAGWSAYYVLPSNELLIFPVACWAVHRCAHGYTMDTIVLTSTGLGTALYSSFEISSSVVANFLVVVAPHQNADAMVRAALAQREPNPTSQTEPAAVEEN